MIKKPLIGILGGMGPYASLRAYKLLLDESISYSNGIKNNDFPHILIDNIPVKELTNSKESLIRTVSNVKYEYERLKSSGANIFIMVCNTMHLHYEKIFENKSDVIILSLVTETINIVKLDGHKIVGILGTVNTVKSGLYKGLLKKEGILSIEIDNDVVLESINDIIKKIIGGVKVGKGEIHILKTSVGILKNKGATAIILGCTELPIAFENIDVDIKLYDPLSITIRKICNLYYSKLLKIKFVKI